MPLRPRIAQFVACLLLAGCSSQDAEQAAHGLKGDEQPRPPRQSLGIVLSAETTYLTAPLDELGYVDYVRALNEQCGQDVTPENNAVVGILRAMGPRGIPPKWRTQFFEALGIEPLPDESFPAERNSPLYYESYYGWYMNRFPEMVYGPPGIVAGRAPMPDDRLKSLEDVLREMDATQSAPWSPVAYPEVASWLDDVKRPLELVVEASQCPRYFEPLHGIHDGAAWFLSDMRELARTLSTRSMLHLGEGRIDECQRDLLVLHRLARLLGEYPSTIAKFTAYAVDGIARKGDLTLAHSGKMTAEESAEYLKELMRLAPLPSMVHDFNVCERYEVLEGLTTLAIEVTKTGRGGSKKDATWPLFERINTGLCDWNIVLRAANDGNDRLVAAFRLPTFQERQYALESWVRELNERREVVLASDVVPQSKDALSAEVADLLLTMFLGHYESNAHDGQERQLMHTALSQIAVALAGYRAEFSKFPESLNELQPTYFDEVPRDRFIDQPLKYSRLNGGYLLYSVGQNLVDEGGVQWPKTAEVVVRFEPPKVEPLDAP